MTDGRQDPATGHLVALGFMLVAFALTLALGTFLESVLHLDGEVWVWPSATVGCLAADWIARRFFSRRVVIVVAPLWAFGYAFAYVGVVKVGIPPVSKAAWVLIISAVAVAHIRRIGGLHG